MNNDLESNTELSLPELFKADNALPAKKNHHINGTTTWTWYVDDDDDCYVQVTDSVKKSGSFLVVLRNPDHAMACLMPNPRDAWTLVRGWLAQLVYAKTAKESDRG